MKPERFVDWRVGYQAWRKSNRAFHASSRLVGVPASGGLTEFASVTVKGTDPLSQFAYLGSQVVDAA